MQLIYTVSVSLLIRAFSSSDKILIKKNTNNTFFRGRHWTHRLHSSLPSGDPSVRLPRPQKRIFFNNSNLDTVTVNSNFRSELDCILARNWSILFWQPMIWRTAIEFTKIFRIDNYRILLSTLSQINYFISSWRGHSRAPRSLTYRRVLKLCT